MAPETLHITLAFLGAVPAQRLPLLCDIAQAIQAEPFELTLDQAGCWGHNRVGWLGAQCVPTALADLAGRLAGALSGAGFALDARAFTPHVTLLRRAQCTAPPAIVPIVWPVTAFALVASVTEANGARYRILAEWPLRSGSPAPGA
jgi:2'-5' RNA ligase